MNKKMKEIRKHERHELKFKLINKNNESGKNKDKKQR